MWSPDGRFLAYRSPRDQVICDTNAVWTVFVSDPTGHVVASFPGDGWQVAWSPDSTHVATWLDSYPGTKIGVYGLDGERDGLVSVPQGKEPVGDFDPTWSPDGESLLLRLTDAGSPNDASMNPNGEVWELPIDGRPGRIVPAEDPRSNWSFTRSPDGTRVAYVVDGPIDGRLVVAEADGSQPRELFHAVPSIYPPVWSPTGDRIAFVSQATFANGEPNPAGSDVRLVDVATERVTTLVPAPAGVWSILAFSPEGDRVLIGPRRGPLERECRWLRPATGREWLGRGRLAVGADRHGPGGRHEPAGRRGLSRHRGSSGRHALSHSLSRSWCRAWTRGPDRAVASDADEARSDRISEGGRGLSDLPPVRAERAGPGPDRCSRRRPVAIPLCARGLVSDLHDFGYRLRWPGSRWGHQLRMGSSLQGELDSFGSFGPGDDRWVYTLGRVSTSVETVVVDVPGIGRVTPTMRNGWYLAWWEGPPPGERAQPWTVTAFDVSGRQIGVLSVEVPE